LWIFYDPGLGLPRSKPEDARPCLPLPSIAESFVVRVTGPKVGSTVDRIATIAELPTAVGRHLAATGREAKEVTLQPTAARTDLDWHGASVRIGNAVDDGIVIGLALWGIAETGSLAFHSSRNTSIAQFSV
jgi:L-lactate dehydrogenase complex protein LldG